MSPQLHHHFMHGPIIRTGSLIAALASLHFLVASSALAAAVPGGEDEKPDALFAAGLYAASKKDWPTAAELFQQVLLIRPNDINALHNLAQALEEQGRHEEALRGFELCLNFMPKGDERITSIQEKAARLKALIMHSGDEAKIIRVRGARGESSVPVGKEPLLNRGDFEACDVEQEDGRWRLVMKLTDVGKRKSRDMARRFFGRPLIILRNGEHVMSIPCMPSSYDGKWVVLGDSEEQVRKWHASLQSKVSFEMYLLYYSADADEDQKEYLLVLLDLLKNRKEDLGRFELHLLAKQLKTMVSRMGLGGNKEMQLMIQMAEPPKSNARSLYEIAHGRGNFTTDVFAPKIHKNLSSSEKKALVMKLQNKLRNEGLDPGPVDGLAGKTTCQALVDYQQAKGLNITANLDNDSLLMLNLEDADPTSNGAGDRRLPALSSSDQSSPAAYLGTMPALDQDGANGVRLNSVLPDGPAEKAGLRRGDIIINLNGKDVPTLRDYLSQMSKLVAGSEVQISVLRDERPMEFKIIPESREKNRDSMSRSTKPSASARKSAGKETPNNSSSSSATPSSQAWEERFRAAAKKFESRRSN